MGRYRSDSSSDEYSRKSKKKKKRRSRSSSNGSDHSHISDSRKRREKKKQKSSSSWSRSGDKKHAQSSQSSRRSRSTSLERYGSRQLRSDSRSSDRRSSRRSRSPPSKRGKSRSRSPPPRRRRSHSRGRRSRSTSRERRRDSRSHSGDRRSYTTDRSHSRRSSVDRHRSSKEAPGSPKQKGLSISESVPGFSVMTPAEQAEERMRQAFRAAAAAGEKLKGLSVLDSAGFSDSKNFAASVSAIESDKFVPSSFTSSRSTKIKEEPGDSGPSHDDAIFGSLALSGFTLAPDPDIKPLQIDSDSIMHPSLYCDPQEKMDRWISRLAQLRRRKLEGEAMQLTVG